METKEAKVELTDKMKGVMDTIEKMTVIELADLVKALEEKFGVTAQAAVAVQAAGAGAGIKDATNRAFSTNSSSLILTISATLES